MGRVIAIPYECVNILESEWLKNVSTIFECNIGNHRYAKVSFMNYSEIGLLDTGANVCIGSTLEKEGVVLQGNI